MCYEKIHARNPTFCIYVLHNGSYLVSIFLFLSWNFLVFSCFRDYLPDNPRKETLSVPLYTELNSGCLKIFCSFKSKPISPQKLKISFIISGEILFAFLYISVARDYMLFMWIETGLSLSIKVDVLSVYIKGTVIQIEKALTNDCLHVSKVSWKFCMPTIYNFVVICLWNLLFS